MNTQFWQCSKKTQFTKQIKKKKTAVSFGADEHIPPSIWEIVDTDGEEEESQETSYKQYVIIDVGGERYQACRDSFTKYPYTRLGKLFSSSNIEEILSLCEKFVPGNPPELFLDRNPENFQLFWKCTALESSKFLIVENLWGTVKLYISYLVKIISLCYVGGWKNLILLCSQVLSTSGGCIW